MTRNEFINDIDTWWDLIDFCREEDCDVCEDVISDDDLSDYIEEDIENAAHDGMSWQEIRDRLNDLDTSYDYYVNDGYMIYNGLDNDDDFEEFKSNVLDWMDSYGEWDEDEEDTGCLPEDEDTANQNSEDTAPLEVEFAVTELMVFDGELTLKDKGGISDNEAFRIATGIVNSENDDKSRICYTIFDLLPDHEFDQGRSSAAYCERRKQLDRMIEELGDNENVRVLPAMYCGTDQSVIETMLNKVVSEDKEGLMINLDVPYQCKRHRGILKVKRFYTMDLPIIRCEPGTGRFHNTLGSIVVDFNGVEVGVGSGFTEEQRDWFWEHKEEIIGTLAEVKYKEISFDKSTGNCSLQFPIFVSLRADKKDVSFG